MSVHTPRPERELWGALKRERQKLEMRPDRAHSKAGGSLPCRGKLEMEKKVHRLGTTGSARDSFSGKGHVPLRSSEDS